MDNIILYEYGNDKKLYVNLTNACTNACKFCIRDYSGVGHDLWLKHQPSFDDVKAAIDEKDMSKYNEVIFCGYGEPMLRFDVLKQTADYLKSKFDLTIRLNTNGQAQLFLKKDVTPELKGRIDVISISLNAASKDKYNDICQPEYADSAYDAVIDFARKCKDYVPKVVMSVVDTFIDENEIAKCAKVAEDIGVEFRVRKFED